MKQIAILLNAWHIDGGTMRRVETCRWIWLEAERTEEWRRRIWRWKE